MPAMLHHSDRITLKMLKYFYTVAKYQHFARAAEDLNISKSPLSTMIKDLEDIIGGTVFSRNTRTVELTILGEALYAECENIFRIVNNSLNKISRISREINSTINIGVISSFFWAGLARALKEINEREPHLTVQIFEMTPEDQKKALKNKKIDLGLSRYADTINISPLHYKKIYHDEMCVITSNKNPLCALEKIHLTDLKESQFIMMKRQDSASTLLVKNTCELLGIDLCIEKEVFEPHTLMALVAMNNSISIVPQSFANQYWDDINFIPLEEKIPAHICGIYDPSNTHPYLLNFVRLLTQTGFVE
ncbi:LysR substrate-binding domain-containing protein [Scandinavium sp. TWS1a]|uniref:LysR substrate-binding domain-containing protein n=1 Tax=Scandinavium tedordense TaxID=2926521 RepID=UPI0021667CE9|nr:LysR substrate-binding domain-containing protein [Scandinavium tedordense]MCS2169515.1 LysR substrate-binding domain-containing protein [Scandinavium tedordense]